MNKCKSSKIVRRGRRGDC